MDGPDEAVPGAKNPGAGEDDDKDINYPFQWYATEVPTDDRLRRCKARLSLRVRKNSFLYSNPS
jgi:hypothetical protein